MAKIVYKTIDLVSVFKLFGGMNFVFGFVVTLFGMGVGSAQFKQTLESIPYIGTMLTGFMGALIFGLVAALVGGIYFALLAAFYNIFAMLLGGVEVEVEEIN
ncbi:MAG: hypothetical protein GY853_14885 [PVC group bacterium]|nr:hypothetical protein [PVC group bacterium]